MTPIDTAQPKPAPSTPTADRDDHLTVLADAIRDDEEHYEYPPVANAGRP